MNPSAKANARVLAGVMFFLLLTFSLLYAETTEADKIDPAEKTEELTSAEGELAEQGVEDPFASKVGPETSIFEGIEESTAPKMQVTLQGIGMGAKDSYAIINDEIFYTGEQKKGIKVLEIKRREVDILAEGEARTVQLFPGEDLEGAQERPPEKRAVAYPSQETRGKIPGKALPGEESSTSWKN